MLYGPDNKEIPVPSPLDGVMEIAIEHQRRYFENMIEHNECVMGNLAVSRLVDGLGNPIISPSSSFTRSFVRLPMQYRVTEENTVWEGLPE